MLATIATLGFTILAHAAEPAPRVSLAIVDTSVIDVEHAKVLRSRTVLIADGRITAIGAVDATPVPPAAERIDGRGLFVIPGLIDLHVHLFNNASKRPPNDWAFPMFVANGVTGVRDMRVLPEQFAQIAQWNAAVDRGERVAPRVLSAGVSVRGETEDDVRQQVRDAARVGAGFIKVFSETPAPHWRAILDEAHRAHLAVDGHVPATVSLLDAAQASQRTSEHLMQAFEACSTIEQATIAARRDLEADAAVARRDEQEHDVLHAFDQRTCTRAATAVAATHLAHVPTLVLYRAETQDATTAYTDDPRWPELREDEQARWTRIIESPQWNADPPQTALRWKLACNIARTLHAAGAPLLAGTDAPMPLVYPGSSLHDELSLLVECGLTPAQALRAATLDAARLLGKSQDIGSVTVGKRADLVLLDGNPLQDIGNTRRVRVVMLNGRVAWRKQLATQ